MRKLLVLRKKGILQRFPRGKLNVKLFESFYDVGNGGRAAHNDRVSGAAVEESRQQLSRVVLDALERDVGQGFHKLPIEGGVGFSHVRLDTLNKRKKVF